MSFIKGVCTLRPKHSQCMRDQKCATGHAPPTKSQATEEIYIAIKAHMAILDIFTTLGPRRGRPEKEMSIIFFSTKCILIVTMKAPTKQSPP